jgi:hypothetical protein
VDDIQIVLPYLRLRLGEARKAEERAIVRPVMMEFRYGHTVIIRIRRPLPGDPLMGMSAVDFRLMHSLTGSGLFGGNTEL